MILSSKVSYKLLALLFASITNATTITQLKQQYQKHPATLKFLQNEWSDNQDQNERRTSKNGYTLLDSEGLYIAMNSLVKTYPDLVTLESAQEKFGLETPGDMLDCPFEGDENGCKMWILTIEDKVAHQAAWSRSSKHLPEVFISGAIHGSERVGPTAVVVTASLLLEAAHCEALPTGAAPTAEDEDDTWAKWEEQITQARYCRRDLRNRGITDADRKWLARLVTTRRIVIVPTANAEGFFRSLDYEADVSPKRDFPFDKTNNTDCFKTITARGINELFRTHMFQISLSYHAGKLTAGYPWGSINYLHQSPPDYEAFDQIAEALSVYGGHFKWNDKRYPTGQINDLLGPTGGRFEDWAYSGEWNTVTPIVKCKPTTYGGYQPAKSKYDDHMLRSVPIIIETSESDKPPTGHLGTDYHIFDPNSKGTGHIPRNIRATLMAIDVVQPYAFITSVNHLALEDDIVPLTNRNKRSCMSTKVVSIPEGTDHVTIEWEVGGAITVDETALWFAKWSDLPNTFDGGSNPPNSAIDKFYAKEENGVGRIAPGGKGKTRWYRAETSSFSADLAGPTFKAAVPTSEFKQGAEIAVFAVVETDKSWENQPEDIMPNISPQSHLVNARTNPDWYYEDSSDTEKIIQGRRQFFSVPVTLKIAPINSMTEELSLRIHDDGKTTMQIIERDSVDGLAVFAVIVILAYLAYVGRKYYLKRKERMREAKYSNVEEKERLGDNVETFELT